MADKSETVDLISEATTQHQRSDASHLAHTHAREHHLQASHLGHWPPDGVKQWKVEHLASWKSHGDWD
jgi:hypothetical protein